MPESYVSGMTLRDHFAALAMAVLLHQQRGNVEGEALATLAYTMADAMMIVRERRQ